MQSTRYIRKVALHGYSKKSLIPKSQKVRAVEKWYTGFNLVAIKSHTGGIMTFMAKFMHRRGCLHNEKKLFLNSFLKNVICK